MWLRNETLEEFKAICRDEFGVELSDVEAHERAVEVLELFWLVLVEDPAATRTGGDVDSKNDGHVP